MTNVSKLLSVLRVIGKVFLLILCCLATLLAILSAVVNHTILNKELYTSLTEREGFAQEMMVFVREELEAECLFYGLPFSVVDDALSSDAVTAFSQEYVQNLYVSLSEGKPLREPDWETKPFVDAVQKFFDSLPEEDKPLDNTAAQTVGGELSVCAVSMLKAGINEKMLTLGHRVFSHPMLQRLSGAFSWLVIAALIAAVLGLLLAWRGVIYHLYVTFFMTGLTSAIVFFSFWLFRRYDPASRLALLDSPLKVYVDALLHSVLDKAVYITERCFVAATVLVLVSVVVQLFSRRAS